MAKKLPTIKDCLTRCCFFRPLSRGCLVLMSTVLLYMVRMLQQFDTEEPLYIMTQSEPRPDDTCNSLHFVRIVARA